MRILVTGASGLLGLNLCLRLHEIHEVFGTVYRNPLKKTPFDCIQIDLAETHALKKMLIEANPDLVIHCAAMANVDQCESHPQEARLINAELPGNLAKICSAEGIKFLHISTDAVFDGKKGDYSEEDEPNPLSVYARTKLDGEIKVLADYPSALVARVNFFGFSMSGDRSLAEFFLYHLLQGQSVKGFVDVIFCPLYVLDLVDVLMAMVEKELSGLYHVVSPECLSKYAFAIKIAEKFNLNKKLIQPVSVMEGNLLARRSPRLSLDVSKLAASRIYLPGQNEGLDHFFRDFRNGFPDQLKSYAA